MSGISSQAAAVRDALLAIGIPRKAFRVRTDRFRRSQVNPHTGQRDRWTEYGDGWSIVSNREARQVAHDRAQELADRKLSVHVSTFACGHVGIVSVSSAWNPTKTVKRAALDGPCFACGDRQ